MARLLGTVYRLEILPFQDVRDRPELYDDLGGETFAPRGRAPLIQVCGTLDWDSNQKRRPSQGGDDMTVRGRLVVLACEARLAGWNPRDGDLLLSFTSARQPRQEVEYNLSGFRISGQTSTQAAELVMGSFEVLSGERNPAKQGLFS